ncbi:hypothetical protein QBC35DRAFT_437683 [Podospora australis]|uniref:Uncharacterized protein n=1 Tax=Podospora australis TaxID=1536484 RepID=A0AAN6WQD5_9PEZI|nr:hypothetical protein QBC35DRAFT_437683 [Podospora australis]
MSATTGTLTAMSLKAPTSVQSDLDLDGLERAIALLAEKPKLQHFASISTENQKLRAENSQLRNDEQAIIRKLGQVVYDLEQNRCTLKDCEEKLKDTTKKNQDLAAKLQDANKELGERHNQLNKVHDEMETRVQSVKRELDKEHAELQRLHSFTVDLIPMMSNIKQITSTLDSIWSSALTLAETWHGIDLPPDILDGFHTGPGVNLREHKVVAKIPLPPLNTAAAKQMRAAAFLAVLYDELRQHLFHPTYLLKHSGELDYIMGNLGEIDAAAESHLRSVLLAVSSKTNSLAKVGLAETVKKNVLDCFEELVTKEQRHMFRSDIDKFCKKTSHLWEFVQQLDTRIEAYHEVDEKDSTDWKPLTLKSTTSTRPPTSTASASSPTNKPRTNGAPVQASLNNKKQNNATSQLAVDTAEASFLKPVMIWPSFFGDNEDTPTLSCGYFLTASHIATAMREERDLESPAAHHHRGVRQQTRKSRTLSFAGGSPTKSQSNSNGSFLSAQGGGGQKGS